MFVGETVMELSEATVMLALQEYLVKRVQGPAPIVASVSVKDGYGGSVAASVFRVVLTPPKAETPSAPVV